MSKVLFIIVAIVLIGGVSLFFLSLQKENVSQSTPTQDISPTSISQTDLGSGGNSYLDKNGVFSIRYPDDYTLDTQDPMHVRVYKRNETQRPQSEMSDGVLIIFESINLSGKSLAEWVDTRIKASTTDGTSKAITQNTYPGFRYMLRGVGSSENIILQKDKNSPHAVLITYSVSDPEQKGYQEKVDAVLSSLKVLK